MKGDSNGCNGNWHQSQIIMPLLSSYICLDDWTCEFSIDETLLLLDSLTDKIEKDTSQSDLWLCVSFINLT